MAGVPARDQVAFSQVYEKGWDALAQLADDPAAMRLYVFLAKSCGHDNAVVATYAVIASAIGLSERTIRRAVRRLEEGEHVVVLKLGSACAYVLNPEEVWKTARGFKKYCAFRTQALVDFSSNPTLKRRLTHVYQGRLALPEDEDAVS